MRFFVLIILFSCVSIGLEAQDTNQTPPAPTQTAPGSKQSDPTKAPDGPAQNPPSPDDATKSAPSSTPDNPDEAPNNGPGVLSRTYTVLPTTNERIRFRPFVSLNGVTGDGLTGATSQNGEIVNQESYGVEVGGGVSGRKIWRKDQLSLDFRTNYYHYAPSSSFDGSNTLLYLTYQHQVSRHIAIALTESGGVYSNNFAVLNSAVDLSIANTGQVVSPNTQLFDNRTVFASTAADAIIQQSARLSFDVGGSGFLVRRKSSSLYGTTGSQARMDTSYRLSRRTTVGAYYGFTHYEFNKAFGGSDINTAGLIYSYAFSKTFELRLRLGGSRVETNGTQTIALDPVIAAILGVSSGTITVYHKNYVPDITAQLSKKLRLGSASVEFQRTVNSGNGVYLTSRQESATGHIDYTGIRRYTFSVGGAYDQLSTLGVLIGAYSSTSVRGGMTRVFTGGFQGDASIEFRHYDIADANFKRDQFRVSVGIVWSPGEKPLKIW